MNYFFENIWIIEIILLILIITVSTIYFKSKESSKWQKIAQILDKIWIKLCLIALVAFWGFAYDKNTIKFIDNNHFTGIYTPNGKEIRFKNSWSTHRFTESEKDKLLAGQKIRIKLKAKKGSWYATGGLKEQEYKGKTFWGFYVEKKEWA